MKTINIFTIFAISTGLALAACGSTTEQTSETVQAVQDNIEAKTLSVDKENSKVVWKGSVLGAHSHEGTVAISEGSVSLKGNKVEGGSFAIDLTSMTPTDENYNEEKTAEMLVGHLSSPDFFDVQNFPTASFTITSVEGSTATGTLTVRGVEGEEKITDISILEENGQVKATGKLTFDRTKYDVSFEHPVKEIVLSNDIDLTISLIAKG